MNRDDIARAIAVNRDRECRVALARSTVFPGYVRAIYLRPGNAVHVEFEVEGLDEGGACFVGHYADLSAATASLERFLGAPMDDWPIVDLDPINESSHARAAGIALGHRALGEAIRTRTVHLPDGASFVLDPHSHWTRFEDGTGG